MANSLTANLEALNIPDRLTLDKKPHNFCIEIGSVKGTSGSEELFAVNGEDLVCQFINLLIIFLFRFRILSLMLTKIGRIHCSPIVSN